MPDIDPAALSRQDSTPNPSITPSINPKSLTINPPSSTKAGKAVQSTPRVDIEPLYAALKNAVGDNWGTYKNAISQFILGELNPDELSRYVDHFLSVDPTREHLHNQLICGIYANLCRDPPENGVAPWVSANDKPTSVTKPATGDGAEQRLKVEVMGLPPRARHRLKHIQDEPPQPLTHAYSSQRESRHPSTSTTTATSLAGNASTPSATATPSTGLNKDLEIRKRYNAPLISETRDLPPTSALTDRLLPICYEEGLSSGPTNPALCAELLSTALENFIKETLGAMMARYLTDAPVSAPTGVIAPSSSERNIAATVPLDNVEPPLANGVAEPIAATTAATISTSTATTAPATSNTAITNGVPLAPSSTPPAAATTAQPPSQRVHVTNPLTLGHGVASTNPPGILTAAYKSQISHEESLCARGLLKRNEAGLLPCEVAAAKRVGRVGAATGAEDWRVSWEIGDVWLKSVVPWMAERVCAGEFAGQMGREEGVDGDEDEDADEDMVMKDAAAGGGVVLNGVGGVNGAGTGAVTAAGGTGVNGNNATAPNGLGLMLPPGDDTMALATDDADWGWQGGTRGDRGALASLLDDCLSVGQ